MANVYLAAAVILNHGDNDNAKRLAAAFEQFGCIDRIIVVDNSGDGGIKKLGGTKTGLLKVPNSGYSAGNNKGVEKIDGEGGADFIIISNPDVFVQEDAVCACIEFLKNNTAYAIAAPRMCAADGTPHHLAAWHERTFLCDFAYSSGILSRLVGMGRECYPESYFEKTVADVDCTAGSFFVIRRDALRRAGGFDEHTFLYYEEDILGFKLKRLGFSTAVLCNYSFLHCEGVSVNKSMNYIGKYMAMQRSRLYFHRRYLKTAMPKYLALCLATALGAVEKSLKTLYYRVKKD